MQTMLLGAAGEVTGSAYLVSTKQARVLVDFGMFQGGPDDDERNIVPKALDPRGLDAVLLTHAHIDHIGRLPLLAFHGFRGPVYATPATIGLAELLLYDSAGLQESDAERENRRRQRAGRPLIRPLYGDREVEALLARLEAVPYDQAVPVAPGIKATWIEAGHMLGSASLQLSVEEDGRQRTLVFSGDLGPHGAPFLKDPGRIEMADMVFLESTYGDRDHRPLDETLEEFARLVQAAAARGGKILVPAFAVGRSQQILYHLAELFNAGTVEEFPVYLDSPLAIKALEIYLKHPELADEEATAMRQSGKLRRGLRMLHTTVTSAESRELNDVRGPCMIIAGSGMCTGGRILHHLRHNLWKRETALLIVGYQAAGTIGRQLAEGAKEVQIFGDPIMVRASVHTLGGFSAHAGQSELLDWLTPMATGKPEVVLTHGEDRGRQPLARLIEQRFGITPRLPEFGDVIEG